MNKLDHTYLKCAEEISELLARIFQQINKKKDYRSHILEEISDLEKQFNKLKPMIENDILEDRTKRNN